MRSSGTGSGFVATTITACVEYLGYNLVNIDATRTSSAGSPTGRRQSTKPASRSGSPPTPITNGWAATDYDAVLATIVTPVSSPRQE